MRTAYVRAAAVPRPRIGLAGIVYVLVGLIVAAHRHYFANMHTVKGIGSAVLALLLWPLLFLGINLHIH